MRPGIPFLAATLLLANAAPAAVPAGPKVVELFTSQGCDSCPPADALLGELAGRPGVLALALHITYWNDLGWEDRFSQDQFDERQRVYVRQLQLHGPYTPQMVIDGAQDVVGSQRQDVERALARAARPVAVALRVDGDAIRVDLPALDAGCDCVLALFAVQANASTPVGRGENAGKTLREFQLVRALRALGKWPGDARTLQVKRARLPGHIDSVAVLAQERATGRVVAAGQLSLPD